MGLSPQEARREGRVWVVVLSNCKPSFPSYKQTTDQTAGTVESRGSDHNSCKLFVLFLLSLTDRHQQVSECVYRDRRKCFITSYVKITGPATSN